jgi:hypothetical protein
MGMNRVDFRFVAQALRHYSQGLTLAQEVSLVVTAILALLGTAATVYRALHHRVHILTPEQIRAEELNIQKFYNGLFPNLGTNFQARGEELKQMIARYRMSVPHYPPQDHTSCVPEIDAHMTYLASQRKVLLSWAELHPRCDDQGVILAPKQGNCCYVCCARGIILSTQFRPIGSTVEKEQGEDAAPFRQEIADWLEANQKDPAVQAQIAAALADYQDALRKRAQEEFLSFSWQLQELEDRKQQVLQSERSINTDSELREFEDRKLKVLQRRDEVAEDLEKIDQLNPADYLRLVRNNGFFASKAELYAISMKYRIQIKVLRQYREHLPFALAEDTPFTPPDWREGGPSITLILKDGNHLDLKVS